MNRFLVIDQNRATAQRLGLRCLEQDIAVIIAENVCEGVRTLAATPVSLIVVDAGGLRLGAREHATLFDRVAPGVPVIVTVRPDVPLETRVAFELAGFRVLPEPLTTDELLKILASVEVVRAEAVPAVRGERRRGASRSGEMIGDRGER